MRREEIEGWSKWIDEWWRSNGMQPPQPLRFNGQLYSSVSEHSHALGEPQFTAADIEWLKELKIKL